MKMTEKVKKPSSLLSAIRAAFSHSKWENDGARSGLASPHIRSDPVPIAFRKSVPLCAGGNMSNSLSFTSHCLSVGQSVTNMEYEDRNCSGFDSPKRPSNEKLGLTQLSFSKFGHSAGETSLSTKWDTENASKDDAEPDLELRSPPFTSAGTQRETLLHHWIEEQRACRGNTM